MAGLDNTAEKQRREQRAKLYKALTERPAEESRKFAEAEIAAFAKALGGSKDKLGERLGRWRFFDAALAEAKTFLADGDKLWAAQDEPSRVERRRFYSRAYINLVAATDQLDPELVKGSTWVVLLDEASDYAKKAADDVIEKAEELIDEIGDGLSSAATVISVGVVLGAVAYGYGKGRR